MSGVHPGDVIAGKFRIERVLGAGGMGYVVAARHLQLGQMVALKFMRDEVCTPEYKSRFLREARNTVRLKSRHVSRVLDVGMLDGGSPYMVMEYLEGTDLSELLHRGGRPLPVPDACDYVIQACEAIAEAHSHGIVHRDLKPANLFLTRGSLGEPVVKVLDFGVSKVLDLEMDDATSLSGRPRAHPDSVVTKATDMLGSPSYMAPEQIASARDADAQSDIWSLGVILFRLLSARAPFNSQVLGELIQQIMNLPAPNLRAFQPDLPPGLEHVVARCLERDRDRRFHDVGELARALAPYATPVVTPSLERIAILGPALVTAPPPSHPTRAPSSPSWDTAGSSAWTGPIGPPPPAPAPPRDLGTWSAIAIGLLAAAVIVAVIVAFLGYRRGELQAPPLSSASAAPAAPATSPAATSPVDLPPIGRAPPPSPSPSQSRPAAPHASLRLDVSAPALDIPATRK